MPHRLSSSLALGKKLDTISAVYALHLAGFTAMCNGCEEMREAGVKACSARLSALELGECPGAGSVLAKSCYGSI